MRDKTKTLAAVALISVSISPDLPDFHFYTPDGNQTPHEVHLDVQNLYDASVAKTISYRKKLQNFVVKLT